MIELRKQRGLRPPNSGRVHVGAWIRPMIGLCISYNHRDPFQDGRSLEVVVLCLYVVVVLERHG